MHGMLSLGVLVAAFTGLAGWAAYVSFRLYRACPAASRAIKAPIGDRAAEDQASHDWPADDRAEADEDQGEDQSEGPGGDPGEDHDSAAERPAYPIV